jgi:hypothetical protein
LKLGKQKLVLERQPWFYRRLVAYRYFWFSEGARTKLPDSILRITD